MLEIIVMSIYFMFPAYAANAAPRILQRLNLLECLARPVDFGKSFYGKPIFGTHKTWRGLVQAPFLGAFVGLLQSIVWQPSYFPFQGIKEYVLLGVLLGSGAILGDLFFAFLKRRLGKKEGSKWVPFDQLNFVIGALALLNILYVPPLAMIVAILIVSGMLHIVANRIAYLMKIQKTKW